MSSASITPQFRTVGWNIHLLYGPESDKFAGLFHPPGSDSLTYRDIVNEIRLCFEIPTDFGADGDIAFGYGSSIGSNVREPLEEDYSTMAMISHQHLARSVSTLQGDPSSNSTRPPIVRLQVVWHTECGIAPTEPLAAHLRGISFFTDSSCIC